jgi:UPF0755 protein
VGTPTSDSESDDHVLFGSESNPGLVEDSPVVPTAAPTRRARRRWLPIALIVFVLGVLGGGIVAVKSFQDRFTVADYTGNGSGSVEIRVNAGDGAGDVAQELKKAGVVKSAKAFTRAAEDSGKAGDIQPGLYRMPLKASGKAALAAILDPKNKLVSKVTIPEGQTQKQILALLASKTSLSASDLKAAVADIAGLGLPKELTPKTAEGFLFPATYQFDPSQSALDVVQTLTSTFDSVWAKLGVATEAPKLKLTPYQALIVASMIESEAKFPEDRPKIARVILNRLAAGMELKIDAVNRYGAVLLGLDPNKVEYATLDSPYNTYTHKGLPPTPISNPGEASLSAAVHPADGNWLYYVVMDAAGHHFFTNDDVAFEQAAQRCRDNNWGC